MYQKRIVRLIREIIIVAVGMIIIFLGGMKIGADIQSAKYTKEKMRIQEQTTELIQQYRAKVEEHAKRQLDLIQELNDAKQQHQTIVSNLRSEFSARMLESENRGKIYRNRAEAAGTECKALAEHAARLDRSLTEGRELVKEFRADLEQCRVAAHHFVDIIQNDRNHFDGIN